jgi:sirohydrochlorin cobaltochelatase
MRRALVLLAHGARNPSWATPFEQVAAQLTLARPDLSVRLAFLELMQPDLPEVLKELAEAGASHVDVMPMFLGGSGHVLRDVPPLLEAARRDLKLSIHMHPALGQQPGMVAAMTAVCMDLVQGPSP